MGEISPKEFAQFIGKEMRLSKVEDAPRVESGPIFNFYMGKNTPERKDYTLDRRVVPVEDCAVVEECDPQEERQEGL